jgi:Putative zinc- or iron-chelating domain
MDGDDLFSALATLLRETAGADPASAAGGAVARVELLIEILARRGVINEGHRRLLAKVRTDVQPQPPRVRLQIYVDKYEQAVPEVDCENRVHLCHARCCSFTVALSRQDVEEGQLLWDIERPYLLRREEDRYCSHLDRRTRACGVYGNRPATCRDYDCRTDRRVWIDFEKMIPAPMPELLDPPGE